MPRYYLNLWDGDLFEEDQEGTELPDVAAARAEALRFASEIMSELQNPERTRIEIASEDGSVLCSIAITMTAAANQVRDRHPV
jgi:predicted regulator of Ras-like GTPase activity (Roadblock/LC7/MglB family)